MGGAKLDVTIHYNPAIEWQRKRVNQFKAGLNRLGFFVRVTQSGSRINDNPVVLFGTSAFKNIEASPGDWLLVDRAFWGDPEYVRLGWNGRGMAGDYKTDAAPSIRPFPKPKKHKQGAKVVLCGDYDDVPEYEGATHFRPHPASDIVTPLPMVKTFAGCDHAVVGSSSVGVEARLLGVQVVFTDRHCISSQPLEWLALTQWSWTEIEHGIEHLFSWLK